MRLQLGQDERSRIIQISGLSKGRTSGISRPDLKQPTRELGHVMKCQDTAAYWEKEALVYVCKHAVANGSLHGKYQCKELLLVTKYVEMWVFPLKIKEKILVKKKEIQRTTKEVLRSKIVRSTDEDS